MKNLNSVLRTVILFCLFTFFSISLFAADGDVLFYRRGLGETDWTAPVFSEINGLFYLGFAYEREEQTHTSPGIVCWDRNGVEKWHWTLEQPTGGFLLNAAEDRLYFGTFGPSLGPEDLGYVYCFNALTGKQIWKCDPSKGLPSDARAFGSTPLLSHDESVLYIGSGGETWEQTPNDNRFYAIDAETGVVQWIYTASHSDREARPDLQALPDSQTAGCGFWADPALGPDGTIYAPNFNGVFYAFNPDGTIKWKYESFYYEDGKRRPSSYSIWHEIWGAPAFNADGSVVYIGSNDWFLHAVDTVTGKLVWKFETCLNGDCLSTTETSEIYVNPIVGPDGTIYFDAEDNHTYALNPDGTLKWRSNAKLTAFDGSTPDRYPSDLAGEENGTKLAFLGTATLLADGTLVAGVDTAGHYIALDSADGSLKWLTKMYPSWTPDSSVECREEPCIDPVTNNIYVGTGWFGGLAVIEGSSPLDTSAPWPKNRKDNRNSGMFPAAEHSAETAAASSTIKVLSFNIAGDSKNWETRKSACYDVINTRKPDIIGFQELLPVNLKWALDNFPHLSWYGLTIEGNSEPFPTDVEGESCRILYDKNRFNVDTDNSGVFWFSPTPDVSSEGWDDFRYCVYVRLVDKETSDGLYLYNTHWAFGPGGQYSRTNAAKIMAGRIADRAHPEDPFIVTGDFNARSDDEGIQILLQNMTAVVEHRIDWIFTENDKYELLTSEIISDINGTAISDHDVLSAALKIKR